MQLSLIGGRSSVMYVLIRKYWIFLQAIVIIIMNYYEFKQPSSKLGWCVKYLKLI